MLATLAAASHNDTQTLWIVLAVICFGVALYLASIRNFIGAIIAGFIGVVVVVLTLT